MRIPAGGGSTGLVLVVMVLVAMTASARLRTTVISFSGSPPAFTDTDADGLPDDWERLNGLDPTDPADATLDLSGDGLTARDAWAHGLDPWMTDSDGDGLADADELAAGTSASAGFTDTDGDGLADDWERACGGSLNGMPGDDTDGDGLDLIAEFRLGCSPATAETADESGRCALVVYRPPGLHPGAPAE